MLNEVGSKIRSWLFSLSPSSSDKEWEDEFEREIDAQVDAVFKMAEEMDDCAEPDGISADFNMNNDALFLKTLDTFNESMKIRRRKNRLGFPVFLVILLLSVLFVRYANPAMWMRE